MSDLTTVVLTSLGTSGIVTILAVIVCIWLQAKIKADVEDGYQTKLEKLKLELSHAYDRRLETLKASFQTCIINGWKFSNLS